MPDPVQPSAGADSGAKRRSAWVWAIAAVWLIGALGGLWVLMEFENRPGQAAHASEGWPAATRLARATERPTLVVLAHPQCFCTRATLAELGEILARASARPKTYVVFLKPSGTLEGWEKTSLWETARSLPDATVVSDDDGLEAGRFGGATSGQTLLYGASGQLLFSGGITGSRGRAGNNAGRAAVLTLLNRQTPDRSGTSVFGCPLFAPATES